MSDIPGQLALRERPHGKTVMLQSWRDLLFLHATVDPADIQALLPEGLTVDTFPDSNGRERAWIGLVPFRMFGIRPIRLPAAPWLSAFPETNVRTYVTHPKSGPGVWFFSLDAARWLACKYARQFFSLPYMHARMRVRRVVDHIEYKSERLERPAARLEIAAEIGKELPYAQAGTLEFFLVERYQLFSYRRGKIFSGRVFHAPYPLRSAEVSSCSQNMVQALGMPCGDWEHVCFSEGVDVEIFGIKSVERCRHLTG